MLLSFAAKGRMRERSAVVVGTAAALGSPLVGGMAVVPMRPKSVSIKTQLSMPDLDEYRVFKTHVVA